MTVNNRCAPRNDPPRVLVFSSRPRRDGNSRRLAEALVEGTAAAGHAPELVHLPDHVGEFLRDCRTCRDAAAYRTIDDGYRELLLEKLLPADALVYATPIRWCGVSGILKTFIDRLFCYIAFAYPDSDRVVERR